MMPELKTLYVRRVDEESDRTLIYGDDPRYHVIAKRGTIVGEGDLVHYEPYGVNFGWFSSSERLKDRLKDDDARR